jgi:hypothetical protein
VCRINPDTLLRPGDDLVAIIPSAGVQAFRQALLGRGLPAT